MSRKISRTNAFFMITIALLFDALVFVITLFHFIPIVGNAIASFSTYIIGLFIGLTFTFWLLLLGVRLFTPKRALTLGAGWFFALIPFLSAFPNWTFSISIIIYLVNHDIPLTSHKP